MSVTIRLQTGASDFDHLVELFREREEHDPLTARFAYLSGRIDEFCAQHCIVEVDRARAEEALRIARKAGTRTTPGRRR